MGDGLADREVGDAGFGDDGAVVEIDLADALELAEAQKHAVFQRQRAAGQRGAGAAGHHLDALPCTIFQDQRNLLGRVGQHNDHRRLPIGRQPIGFIGPHLGGAVDHAFARHDCAQCSHDLGAAREHGLVARGHHDGHNISFMAYPSGQGRMIDLSR
ncbi:hypothetical protein ACVWXM_004799 [Bradyrhizobium sp. GM7.3]